MSQREGLTIRLQSHNLIEFQIHKEGVEILYWHMRHDQAGRFARELAALAEIAQAAEQKEVGK